MRSISRFCNNIPATVHLRCLGLARKDIPARAYALLLLQRNGFGARNAPIGFGYNSNRLCSRPTTASCRRGGQGQNSGRQGSYHQNTHQELFFRNEQSVFALSYKNLLLFHLKVDKFILSKCIYIPQVSFVTKCKPPAVQLHANYNTFVFACQHMCSNYFEY